MSDVKFIVANLEKYIKRAPKFRILMTKMIDLLYDK